MGAGGSFEGPQCARGRTRVSAGPCRASASTCAVHWQQPHGREQPARHGRGNRTQRGEAVVCETVAFPNYSLDDHLDRGDAVRAIARGSWSVVVLQQGPSALPDSQVQLRGAVRKFDAEVRRAGARTALYMVWPSQARRVDFEGVSRSYTDGCRRCAGAVVPAGDAWRAAWRRDSTWRSTGTTGFILRRWGRTSQRWSSIRDFRGGLRLDCRRRLESPSGAFPSIALRPDVAALLQQAAVVQ